VHSMLHQDSEHRRVPAVDHAVAPASIPRGWCRGEDLPLAIMLRRADDALGLHFLDQPGGAVVADAELPLHAGD